MQRGGSGRRARTLKQCAGTGSSLEGERSCRFAARPVRAFHRGRRARACVSPPHTQSPQRKRRVVCNRHALNASLLESAQGRGRFTSRLEIPETRLDAANFLTVIALTNRQYRRGGNLRMIYHALAALPESPRHSPSRIFCT